MKAKIFAKLKQEYSALGLGDDILMSRAESLAALGLVTDENIDAVVACQRSDFEALQKANDKRVTDALEKAQKKHNEETQKRIDDAVEKAKKEAEEALKGKQTQPAEPPKPTDSPEIAALRERIEELVKQADEKDKAHASTLKGLADSRASLEAQVKSLIDKNSAAEAAAAKAAREAKIVAKAKELGVPEWRISEGFSIADDATDEAIAETLSKVANNISTNLLPGNRGAFPLSGGEPTKEDLSAMAASLIK